MSRLKLITFIALITLAFGVALVGDALAGEKVKGRKVDYTVKFQTVDIPDQQGHILYVYEMKGITTIFEGPQAKKLWDGNSVMTWGIAESNPQTKQWSGRGYNERVDRDGDKVYTSWQGQSGKEGSEGTVTVIKGTGKYEGIKGEGTWSSHVVAPNQGYTDFEYDMEWPGR